MSVASLRRQVEQLKKAFRANHPDPFDFVIPIECRPGEDREEVVSEQEWGRMIHRFDSTNYVVRETYAALGSLGRDDANELSDALRDALNRDDEPRVKECIAEILALAERDPVVRACLDEHVPEIDPDDDETANVHATEA